MEKKAVKKPECIGGEEKEEILNKIKQTDASAVARQKRQKEIENFLDDLITRIVGTFEQTERSEEQTVNTKDLLKELNKPSEILKRINGVNIVQYLNGNRCMNLQTSEEETPLNSSSILGESAEDCVKDVIENIIETVESEKRNSEQSVSKRTETKMGYIDTNGQVTGEEILKEIKMVEKIEQRVKNLINDVQETLENNFSENDKNKSIEKLELPIKLLDESNQPVEEIKECFQNPLSNASLDSPVQTNAIASDFKNDTHKQSELTIEYLEQEDILKPYQQPNEFSDYYKESNMLFDCLQQTKISEDSLQQTSILTDCLPKSTECLLQSNISTDCLQHSSISTDCLQQLNESTDCLEQKSISADLLQQSKSVDLIQLTKAVEDLLHRTSMQADSFQQTSTSTNFGGQTNMPAHSLTEEFRINDYLKETIETAYQVLKDPSNISHKSRRAATLIRTVAERLQPAKNQTNQRIDNLKEIQNMTEIIDGVGDLNDYLQMDIRTIFLEQRELKRISSYILEHLSTIAHCRSEKFIKNDAIQVIKSGMKVLQEIKSVKMQMWKLFRDLFLIQRSFLIHSLKFSSVPYELLIGDSRYSRLVNQVKASVIGMCGNVFGMEDLGERYEIVKVDYKNIAKYVERFTNTVVFVDHKPDQRPWKELEDGIASKNSILKCKRMKEFQKHYEIFSSILAEIEIMNDYYREDIILKNEEARDIHCITLTVRENVDLLKDLSSHTINLSIEDGEAIYTLNVLDFGAKLFKDLSSLLSRMRNYLDEYNEFRVKFHNLSIEYSSAPLEQLLGSEWNDLIDNAIEKSKKIYAEFFGDSDEIFHTKFVKLSNDLIKFKFLYNKFNDYVDMLADQ